jgi:hypothetical protein
VAWRAPMSFLILMMPTGTADLAGRIYAKSLTNTTRTSPNSTPSANPWRTNPSLPLLSKELCVSSA